MGERIRAKAERAGVERRGQGRGSRGRRGEVEAEHGAEGAVGGTLNRVVDDSS